VSLEPSRTSPAPQDFECSLPPSHLTGCLGAPWLPTDVIQDFVREVMGGEVEIFHTAEVAVWGVKASWFAGAAQSTSEWGTARRHAGQLLHDALTCASLVKHCTGKT
jgi:N12 class adenine-specific DNA methylase